MIADDINQTGPNFHLASIYFRTSKRDVLMRLAILDNNKEIISAQGQGCLILPVVYFMRKTANVARRQLSSRTKSRGTGDKTIDQY